MNKKPFYNATLAAGYIVFIVNLIGLFFSPNTPDAPNLLIPIMMLSLLVLSVAIMAYLFGYDPIRLYSDGEKDEAGKFLISTIAYFAAYVLIFVISFVYSIQ